MSANLFGIKIYVLCLPGGRCGFFKFDALTNCPHPPPPPNPETHLEAVRGRLMAEKRRSETARLMTKVVVAWERSLAHRNRATTVNRFPAPRMGLVSRLSRSSL
jgi:hypothetical protein